MGERALHFKIRADPPESAASPRFFAIDKILAWIIHDEFGESGKGHGFHRLRKNSRMYGSPWKSGPSGPRKPVKSAWALAGCGKTLIHAGFGKGTTSVVPLSRLDLLAL